MADEAKNAEQEADEEIEVDDIPEEQEEGDDNKIDWKAHALKQAGIAKRLKTRLDKQKLESKVEKKVEERVSGGLDRIDRAVLRAEKITDEAEIDLVKDLMKETGKTVEQVLESKYFQSELKELREAKATKEATPTGTKRSGATDRGSVEYWLAKGELPTDQALRTKVVNAKIAKEKATKAGFSDNAVIG